MGFGAQFVVDPCFCVHGKELVTPGVITLEHSQLVCDTPAEFVIKFSSCIYQLQQRVVEAPGWKSHFS